MGRPAHSPLEVATAVFRDATLDDMWFVIDLMVQGAQSGTFGAMFGENAGVNELMAHLQPLILTHTLRAETGRTWSRLFILEIARNRAGFVWLARGTVPRLKDSVEILAIAMTPMRRGFGHGSKLLGDALSFLHRQFARDGVCARCLPASEIMTGMLCRRGFKVIESGVHAKLLHLHRASAVKLSKT
jgi:hypothetical protein